MSTAPNKSLKSKNSFSLVLLIALAGGFLFAQWQGKQPRETEAFSFFSDVGGNFELAGGGGKRVQLKDFLGRLVVLLFGYTHCPDACPTSLFTLKKSLELVGKDADQVQVIMVTIDPKRDNAEHMQKYVTHFDPGFVGLSGTIEEIDKVVNLFRGQYKEGQKLPGAGYLMSHSTHIYLMDKNGKVRKLHNERSTPEEFAKDLQLLMRQG